MDKPLSKYQLALAETERTINAPVRDLVRKIFPTLRPFGEDDKHETTLHIGDEPIRPDFAYIFRSNNLLFIEDDSKNTCLSNLTKYWCWFKRTEPKPCEKFYLIHIIAPKKSVWVTICDEISRLLMSDLKNAFEYKLISTENYPDPKGNPEWLQELSKHLLIIKNSEPC